MGQNGKPRGDQRLGGHHGTGATPVAGHRVGPLGSLHGGQRAGTRSGGSCGGRSWPGRDLCVVVVAPTRSAPPRGLRDRRMRAADRHRGHDRTGFSSRDRHSRGRAGQCGPSAAHHRPRGASRTCGAGGCTRARRRGGCPAERTRLRVGQPVRGHLHQRRRQSCAASGRGRVPVCWRHREVQRRHVELLPAPLRDLLGPRRCRAVPVTAGHCHSALVHCRASRVPRCHIRRAPHRPGRKDHPVAGFVLTLAAPRLSPCPRSADLLLI